MGNFMQKISKAGLILVLIGGFLLGVSLGDTITSFQQAKSFGDLLESAPAPGDHVEGQVLYLLDAFANEQTWTENTSTGSTTPKKTSAQYYVVPVAGGYVGLRVSSQNFSAADKLVDQTYDYLTGGEAPTAEFTTDARVAVMEDDLADMFLAEMKEYYGYTDQDLAAIGTPLMIEPRSFVTVQAFCAAGAAVFLVGAVMLVLHWRKISRQIRQSWEEMPGPDLD